MDTTCLQRTNAGTSTMVRGFFAGMKEAGCPVDYIPFQPPFAGLRQLGKIPQKMDTLLKDGIWTQKILPRKLAACGCQLFHAPYNHTPERIPIPFVVTILDLYIRKRPEAFTAWSVMQYVRSEKMLKNASGIFCISEFTRQELLHYCPEIDPDKTRVTHLAASRVYNPRTKEEVDAVLENLQIHGPYVLWVGTIEPRKNILEILQAVQQEPRLRNLQFVLVGKSGWVPEYAGKVDDVIAKTANFHKTGFISEESLAALYSGALAFLFPSHYEGFGLPVLEAMACGCPVIAAKGSSLDEICGGFAQQLDPEDPAVWVDALLSLLQDTGAVPHEAKILQDWASGFSWLNCAKEMFEAYTQILARTEQS